MYEYHDVHALILGALNTYVGTDDNILHLFNSGCIKKLLAYLEVAKPGMKPHCLVVFTKMSYTAIGRQVRTA